MKRCGCGASHRLDEIRPAYIQPGFGTIPKSIAFHCGCRSTLNIPWPDAPDILRQRAIAVEVARLREGAAI